ncbi:MAG: class I SAM-dependent methyltransferase [Gammaproteobacteria bacterium]|nr:class I SAM-dependent methyltransferase [Gammaproteobacteria bacterium]
MNTSSHDKGWSEYWSNDGAAGEVFVNAQGQAHPEIASWWREAFANLPPRCRIIDLACGAGSVFAHIPGASGHHLHGADISKDALDILRQRMPGVDTTVCSADKLVFADHSFDVVVSQFGVEYAGFDAFCEAARIVAPAGSLWVLCHYADGYIDARNARHLEQAKRIVSSDFIARARDLISAVTAADTSAGSDSATGSAVQAAAAAFAPAEQELRKACEVLPEGIHAHLYAGFRQLYENRSSYHVQDILKWLDDMRADVDLNIHRLSHMREAASNAVQLARISNMLKDAGFGDVTYEPLQISSHTKPLAWALTAQRHD